MSRVAVTSTIFNLLPYLKSELLAQFPDCKFYAGEPPITEDWLIDLKTRQRLRPFASAKSRRSQK